MNPFKNLFLILLMGLLCAVGHGQTQADLNRALLNKELEKRNLNYDDVEKRLREEGFDVDSLDINTLSPEDQQKIENILIEMSNAAPVIEQVEDQKEEETTPQAIVEPIGQEATPRKNTAQSVPVEIYGQDLFRNAVIQLINNSNQLKAPESYVLGQGDQLVISIWGRSQLESSHTIQSDGFIRLVDGRLRVYVKGLTIAEARNKLRNFLSREYSFEEGEFEIAVNYARTVRVSIYGEVLQNPGSYTISGFNSGLNALSLVGGPNNIGSLRNIKLQKANGQSINIDVYEFMTNPSVQSQYYLEDNDIILVPVSDKIVKITGAVRRPFKYELKSGEGLQTLLDLAGGMSENAFRKKIQIKRYENNQQKIIDIDLSDLNSGIGEYTLLNGDEIYVENIERPYRNYVSITGEVQKPGEYERLPAMRVLDLVNKAGLLPNANLDLIYLIRTKEDGTNELVKINLSSIQANPDGNANILLNERDKIEIWSQERFADQTQINVAGAVRFPGSFPFDRTGQTRVTDAIQLAGGLRRDASSFATIFYNDPLRNKSTYYKTIEDLESLINNPDSEENVVLNAFDSLVVQSVNRLDEKLFVRIEGAVNDPGTFQFGDGMTLKDLIILAGGFKTSAARKNIEVSRAMIKDNEPVNVVVANLEIDENYDVISKGVASDGKYILEPYDNVAVRYIKDFDLQERVFIKGEVNVPGPYALYENNQRILSVINRAGGLTQEAFPEGATLLRNDSKLGPIVIKLDEIISDPGSEFNFILRDGDEITIPKINEFVAIKGATRVKEVALESNISDYNLIRVPYHSGKDALFYIEQFAGGFDDKADKSKVFVEYANGEIKQAKRGLFKCKYPEVRKGSVITVGYKQEEEKKETEKDTDWSKVLQDSVGQALSILTLILLVQRID